MISKTIVLPIKEHDVYITKIDALNNQIFHIELIAAERTILSVLVSLNFR